MSDRIQSICQGFQAAALGTGSWHASLNDLACEIGARNGQMIALGPRAIVPLNIMTEMPEESAAEFVESGGGQPAVNSRVRLGTRAPELHFLDESDFTTEEDKRKNPEFGAWIDRYDIGYTCISKLIQRKDVLIGLAAFKGQGQDSLTDVDKRKFMFMAEHMRSAISVQLAVEAQGIDLMTAALDNVSASVLIVDMSGHICAMTRRAEQHLREGRWCTQSEGRLRSARFDQQAQIESALATAIAVKNRQDVSPPGIFVLRDRHGLGLPVEIAPIPPSHGFHFAAAAMIILHTDKDPQTRLAEMARQLYGLTTAETQVARLLLDGKSAKVIQAELGIGVGTVRTHIHRILGKSECASQSEFIARMAVMR